MDYVQTAVATGATLIKPGMLYDSAHHDVVTKIAAEAIPYFGLWVCFTADDTCELGDSETEVSSREGGIALIDPVKATVGSGYAAGDAVPVLRRGRCGVKNEETISLGDAVYVRVTATDSEVKGALRSDSDGGDGFVPRGAAWFRGGAEDLAILELGLGATGATGAAGPTGPTGPTGS